MKSQRMVKELHNAMWPVAQVNSNRLLTSEYLDVTYTKAMKPLKSGDKTRVHEAAEILDTYRLTKDHLSDHITDIYIKPFGSFDQFKILDTSVKTALTKEYNSGKYGTWITLVKKKRKREKGQGGLGGEDGEEDEDGGEPSSEEELPASL